MIQLFGYNPIVQEDLVKIQIALQSLYEFVMPGITLSPAEAEAMTGENLSTYSEKNADRLDEAVFLHLSQKGLAAIAAMSFLFCEKYFSLGSIFVENEFLNSATSQIARLVCRAPTQGLYPLIQQFYPNNRPFVTSEGGIFFGDKITIHHDGENLFFPLVLQEKWHFLKKNTLFNEATYPLFLSVMLMPLSLFNNIFCEFVRPEVAVFIASFLSYHHSLFFNAFIKSVAFLDWYFFEPTKRIDECLPGRQYRLFLEKNEEAISDTKAKVVFLLAKTKIEKAAGLLNELIALCLKNKKVHQALDVDLHAFLIAVRACLFGFLDGNGSHFLEWFEKSDLLYKKIQTILVLLEYMQIEIDAFQSSKLSLLIDVLKMVLPSLLHTVASEEDKEYDCCEADEESGTIEKRSVKHFFSWVNKINEKGELENLPVLLCHHERVYRAFLKTTETPSKQFYAAASSYVSSFLGAPTVRPTFAEAPFSATHFDEMDRFFHEATTPDQLQRAFVNLLAIRGHEIEPVHKEFLTALVLQFERESIAMELAFSENPALLKNSYRYMRFIKLDAASIESIVMAFIKKMRPAVIEGLARTDSSAIDSFSAYPR